MNLVTSLAKRFLLLTAPVVASSALVASPSLAATFAFSESYLELDGFSHKPGSLNTLAVTETFTFAESGAVEATGSAVAFFGYDPNDNQGNNDASPVAFNHSLSTAEGEGTSYSGVAKSGAAVTGYNFSVKAGETFSFGFRGFLDLFTSIDTPKTERARAAGGAFFHVYDTSDDNNWTLLDSFDIFANIFTSDQGNGDFISPLQHSDNIALNPGSTGVNNSFGGNEESASADFDGSYSRTFENATSVTLVEAKGNYAKAEGVPEPSFMIGSLLFTLMGAGYRAKNKNRKSSSTVSE
ncbi:MAG: PEP-CTERM sorting domain-containing protein [Symploca sp. SIO3E6]|nr:PEP-CTERM sorting domain-containing protein [Caldora sp. SIO3E6]